MSDRLLSRYTGVPRPQSLPEPAVAKAAEVEQEVTDDCGAFGWLRGTKERAVMLELRKRSGNVLAIGYGWLERIEFDPSEGITLHGGGQKIRIKGRNLNAEQRPLVRLFEGMVRHRVPWVKEADRGVSLQATAGTTVVDAVEW